MCHIFIIPDKRVQHFVLKKTKTKEPRSKIRRSSWMHWARGIGMLNEVTVPVKKSMFLVRRKWGLFSNSLFANQYIYWITSLLHYDAFGVYNLLVLFILSMFLNERVLYKIMGSVREKEAHPLHIMFWGQRRKLQPPWISSAIMIIA